jgi:hypothetical protein
MNKIAKVLLTLFASVAFASTMVVAGEVSVTGSAVASYRIDSSDSTSGASDTGKALGITNELTFGASGELDNGIAWSYATELDSGAATTSGAGIDDTQIKLTSDMGTVGIMISEGSLRGGAYGWDVTANGAGSDNGAGGSGIWGTELSSWNNLQYSTPSGMLPFGLVVSAGQSIGGGTAINSKNAGGAAVSQAITNGTATVAPAFVTDEVTQYQIVAAPIDGLTVKADYLDVGGVGGTAVEQTPEEGHISAKYTFAGMPVSIGYGRGWIAHGISDDGGDVVESTENTSMGIGFTVNDNLSVSYSQEESNRSFATAATAEVELAVTSLQAAYTMGGMTFSVSLDDIENSGYTQDKDQNEALFNLALAF